MPWLSDGFSQSMRSKTSAASSNRSSRQRPNRSHAGTAGTAGCRSTPTGARRRSQSQRKLADAEADFVMPDGSLRTVIEDEVAEVRMASRQRRSASQSSMRNFIAAGRSPAFLRSGLLDDGIEQNRRGRRPGSACSISKVRRSPRAITGFAQSSTGSSASPQ